MLVYWIPITYNLCSQKQEFGVMSDIPWVNFWKVICQHMIIDPEDAHFVYQIYVDGYPEGLVSHLRNKEDWRKAMQAAGGVFDLSNDVELEVLDMNSKASSEP
jgi:hypothetical protein